MSQNPHNDVVMRTELETTTTTGDDGQPPIEATQDDSELVAAKFPVAPNDEPEAPMVDDADAAELPKAPAEEELGNPSPAHFILIEPKHGFMNDDEEDDSDEEELEEAVEGWYKRYVTRSKAAQKPKKPVQKKLTLIGSWNDAIKRYFPRVPEASIPFTVIEGKLEEIPAETIQCDCLVSPANSFGIMDGGYDYILSHVLRGPTGEFWTITDQVQSYLAQLYRGYLPPGSCIIVPIPKDVAGPVRWVQDPKGWYQDPQGNPARRYGNPWGATTVAVLPTMRVPDDMTWHKDLVYNSMWNLMAEIEKWNTAVAEADTANAKEGEPSAPPPEGAEGRKKKINRLRAVAWFPQRKLESK
ncbi:hypothetical protein FRC17_010266 [Serendipita sp. 399]|nr:hypothetical protein FRC17_010266 [Serendipita sp. 399]